MEYKYCGGCESTLPINDFGNNKRKKDGLQTRCKDCAKNYRDKYYKADKQSYIDRAKEQRIAKRKWWKEYKSTLSCSKCGENHPSCIDFHHLDPATKVGDLSQMMATHGKQNILDEIAKCIIVCANCHRKIHWDEKQ